MDTGIHKTVSQISGCQPVVSPRQGCCPTCGQETRFIFLGEQRWPEKVAAKLGMPAVILQWTCEACQTTLSEPQA